MGTSKSKYHVTEDGRIFEVRDDGSVIDKGTLESVVDQSKGKKSGLRLSWKLDWKELLVYAGIIYLLICHIDSHKRFFEMYFEVNSGYFRSCWNVLAGGICAWLSIRLARKMPDRPIWIYLSFCIGIFFLFFSGNSIYCYSTSFWPFTCVSSVTVTMWALSLNSKPCSKNG